MTNREVRHALINASLYGWRSVVEAYDHLPDGDAMFAARDWLSLYAPGTWQRIALDAIETREG